MDTGAFGHFHFDYGRGFGRAQAMQQPQFSPQVVPLRRSGGLLLSTKQAYDTSLQALYSTMLARHIGVASIVQFQIAEYSTPNVDYSKIHIHTLA